MDQKSERKNETERGRVRGQEESKKLESRKGKKRDGERRKRRTE